MEIKVKQNCTGCGLCLSSCLYNAIEIVNKKARINDNCILCGACVDACRLKSIEITGLVKEKIKFYDLGIDINKYTQKANSYLLFYTLLIETKKWTDYPPYKYGVIWRKMPIKILSKFHLNDDLKSLYLNKCYKKKSLKNLP